MVGLKDSRVVGERVAQDLSPCPIQITHNRKTSGSLQRIHGVGGGADEPERCSRTSPPARTSASVCKPASRTSSRLLASESALREPVGAQPAVASNNMLGSEVGSPAVVDYAHMCRTRMGAVSTSRGDYALSNRHLTSHTSPEPERGSQRSCPGLSVESDEETADRCGLGDRGRSTFILVDCQSHRKRSRLCMSHHGTARHFNVSC